MTHGNAPATTELTDRLVAATSTPVSFSLPTGAPRAARLSCTHEQGPGPRRQAR
jgi:hypothetical protein